MTRRAAMLAAIPAALTIGVAAPTSAATAAPEALVATSRPLAGDGHPSETLRDVRRVCTAFSLEESHYIDVDASSTRAVLVYQHPHCLDTPTQVDPGQVKTQELEDGPWRWYRTTAF
ncbi:hypothetical protein [Streptomyces sp. NPDC013187]|uniref:hypothetical protein n=1 Tax=Streptomyces sp. NPDC013187 TaxID=3364865 RepID=UPI0036A378CB